MMPPRPPRPPRAPRRLAAKKTAAADKAAADPPPEDTADLTPRAKERRSKNKHDDSPSAAAPPAPPTETPAATTRPPPAVPRKPGKTLSTRVKAGASGSGKGEPQKPPPAPPAGDKDKKMVLHAGAAAERLPKKRYVDDCMVDASTMSGTSLGSLEQYSIDWNAADASEVSSATNEASPVGTSNLAQHIYGISLMVQKTDRVAAVCFFFCSYVSV